MLSNALTLPTTASAGLGVERLDQQAQSAYWLRFLNGHWLIYRHERLIADFPAENATLALRFLRLKQGNPLSQG